MQRSTKEGKPKQTKIEPDIGRKTMIANRFNAISPIGFEPAKTYLNYLFTEPIGKKDKISPVVAGMIRQITEKNLAGDVKKFFIDNKPVQFGTQVTKASDLSDDQKASILRTICYMNKIGFKIRW